MHFPSLCEAQKKGRRRGRRMGTSGSGSWASVLKRKTETGYLKLCRLSGQSPNPHCHHHHPPATTTTRPALSPGPTSLWEPTVQGPGRPRLRPAPGPHCPGSETRTGNSSPTRVVVWTHCRRTHSRSRCRVLVRAQGRALGGTQGPPAQEKGSRLRLNTQVRGLLHRGCGYQVAPPGKRRPRTGGLGRDRPHLPSLGRF